MATENDDDTTHTVDNDDEGQDSEGRPMPKQLHNLFGNVILSGASKAVETVGAGASYVVSPITSRSPNMWPDMDNIDNLVEVLTITGYTFTAFSIIGSTYFLAKTAREIGQWRYWLKYRHLATRARGTGEQRRQHNKTE
eukprot:gene127-738_t